MTASSHGIPESPSRTSRVLESTLRATARPVMDRLPGSPLTVHAARGMARVFMPRLAPARQARVRAVHTRYDGRPVRGEWVRHDPRSTHVILYLHGGGFVCCSPRTHRGLIAQLATRAGVPAFALEYRLAPKYRFPAAADDALGAYRWLLANGYRPDDIVIAGDSAGGHLALGLGVALHAAGLPAPAGLVLLSPLVDFSGDTAARCDAVHHDPYLSAGLAKRALALYGATGDPRLELLRGDLSGLPPILLQAGGAEMLCGDARALAAHVEDAGGDCTLQVWPGQMHVFQALYRLVPESRAALAEAGEFVRARFVTRLTEPLVASADSGAGSAMSALPAVS